MKLRFLPFVMAALLATPALAAEAPNGNPDGDRPQRSPAQAQVVAPGGVAPAPEAATEPVIIMPASWINAVLEYLASRPWKEVNGALSEARGCLALQSQHATGGAIVSHGECRAVMAALQAQMRNQSPAAQPAPAGQAAP